MLSTMHNVIPMEKTAYVLPPCFPLGANFEKSLLKWRLQYKRNKLLNLIYVPTIVLAGRWYVSESGLLPLYMYRYILFFSLYGLFQAWAKGHLTSIYIFKCIFLCMQEIKIKIFALTRIWTGVIAATTQCTNQFTITATSSKCLMTQL